MSRPVNWSEQKTNELSNALGTEDDRAKGLIKNVIRFAFNHGRKQLAALERARPLCPDCRDKCAGITCLRCEIQLGHRLLTKTQDRLNKMVELTACERLRIRSGTGEGWQLLNCETQKWETRSNVNIALDEEIERDKL